MREEYHIGIENGEEGIQNGLYLENSVTDYDFMEMDGNTYIPDIDNSTSVPLSANKTASLSNSDEDESRRQFFVWQARSERRLIK